MSGSSSLMNSCGSSSIRVVSERDESVQSKRRHSSSHLTQYLSRRKSLQTTALATRRQSLWMSIARNGASVDSSSSPLRAEQPTNNKRKKCLRLLLVVSYLLSISLLAIALATFYGFFWAGYSPTSRPNSTRLHLDEEDEDERYSD